MMHADTDGNGKIPSIRAKKKCTRIPMAMIRTQEERLRYLYFPAPTIIIMIIIIMIIIVVIIIQPSIVLTTITSNAASDVKVVGHSSEGPGKCS